MSQHDTSKFMIFEFVLEWISRLFSFPVALQTLNVTDTRVYTCWLGAWNIFRVTGPLRGIHWWPVDSPHKASNAELWCLLWSTLCKQWRCRWLEIPSYSLWCHCNGTWMFISVAKWSRQLVMVTALYHWQHCWFKCHWRPSQQSASHPFCINALL